MNTLSTLKEKTTAARLMPEEDLRDLILNGINYHKAWPSKAGATLLNWWIDVYNFRRGKEVIKRVSDAVPKKTVAY